jgi:hypothetical protein
MIRARTREALVETREQALDANTSEVRCRRS